ncbi:hypothetical protein IAI18_00910 [Acetobacteraceae bacterium H6797]|nr:hypothetical protein [Acetobacteraceae bacterium H6797]
MLAGAVIALTVGIMLNVLGAGIGTMLIDTTARDTPDATNFGLIGAAWVLIANLIGLFTGAYAAARLSGTADGTDGTLHGIAVWGTTFLISALLIGNLAMNVASTATTGAANLLGGMARGTGAVLGTAGEQVANRAGNENLPDASSVQAMIDRARSALEVGGDPATMNSDQRKAEMAKLVARRVTDGPLPAGDRDRLVALVSAEYGISQDDARQRVDQLEQQTQQAAQQAEEQARHAADAAAKGASIASFSIFATMLLGLIAAILGSRSGTRAVYEARVMVRDRDYR